MKVYCVKIPSEDRFYTEVAVQYEFLTSELSIVNRKIFDLLDDDCVVFLSDDSHTDLMNRISTVGDIRKALISKYTKQNIKDYEL